ncbi:hypothetical protein PLESTM_001292900 [Pleodorina starrii]|nr:hypothetical protein PLESTM_001292900 [Pleodorina starrii]
MSAALVGSNVEKVAHEADSRLGPSAETEQPPQPQPPANVPLQGAVTEGPPPPAAAALTGPTATAAAAGAVGSGRADACAPPSPPPAPATRPGLQNRDSHGPRCDCPLCVAAGAALRCDPWVAALPPEDLAALACQLRRALAGSNHQNDHDHHHHRHCQRPASATLPGAVGGSEAMTAWRNEAEAAAPVAQAPQEEVVSESPPPPPAAPQARDGVQAWVAATGGQPLLALLRLYSVARRGHRKAGGTAGEEGEEKKGASGKGVTAAAAAAPCCMAAKQLLAAVVDVCREAPAAVRREVAAATAVEGQSEGEQLAKGLVAEVRQLLEGCPRCLLQKLGRDGRVASYDAAGGIVAADPCRRPASSGRASGGAAATASTATAAAGQPQQLQPDDSLSEQPLVVVAMRALSQLCACSRRAARSAYTAGALDLLQEAGRRMTRGSALEAEADALYVALAAQCQAAADDICTSSDVRGLAALMAASPPPPPSPSPPPQTSPPPSTSAAELEAVTAAVAAAAPAAAVPCNRVASAAAAAAAAAAAVMLPPQIRLRAAARLCVLVDTCDPDDFSLLCRGGATAVGKASPAAAPLLTALSWIRCSLRAPRDAAAASACGSGTLTAAAVAAAGEADAVATGNGVDPEAVRTAARLLLACLERGHRTGWIRGGCPAVKTAPNVMNSSGGSGGGRCVVVSGLRDSLWAELTATAMARLETEARESERTGRPPAAAAAAPPPPEADGAAAAAAPPPPPKQCASGGADAGGKDGRGPVSASGGAAAGCGGGKAGGAADGDAEYDEDGLRTVWDSGPKPEVAAARAAWAAVPLRERVRWSQTSTDVYVTIRLPPGTRKGDVGVSLSPQRLAVRLGWCGRLVDGPLHRGVLQGECVWALEGDSLQVLLAKAERGHYWRALFEGGEEKGLYEVLREAVEADEPVLPYDSMDESSRLLLEELLERQSMVADGSFDLEKSFDDFRLVVGDNTL